MSTSVKKPPAPGSVGRRPIDPSSPPPRVSSKSPTRSTTSSTNGVARTRSIRGGSPASARTSIHRPGVGASNLSSNSTTADMEYDAHAETVALLDELKEKLRASEIQSDQFQKDTEILQSRLDEALQEQARLEDRVHEAEKKLEVLEAEKRDVARQKRDMEATYEAERSSMTREREEFANKEEEMQAVIQRLKDNLSQKFNGDDEVRHSRPSYSSSNNSSPTFESSHFAPTAAKSPSDSGNNSKLLLQKDRLIESLRLELAEAQIKLVESENMEGGRIQEVERLLLDARMTNVRLMEDNESYQLLLSERTLNGGFTKTNFGYVSPGGHADTLSSLEGRTVTSSLADELSEAGEGEGEDHRRLEAELKSTKDQNKALTLYINKIIERLLQHQDFEAILDQSSDFKPPAVDLNKELPAPPKDLVLAPSMLQRAKSAAMGPPRRPTVMSQVPAHQSALSDPETAPSIPIGLTRGSSVRRNRPASEQFAGAANVVNHMYKGQGSPPLHVPQMPRAPNSFFSPPPAGKPDILVRAPSDGNQVPASGTLPSGKTSETSSASSTDAGEVNTPPSNSPPRTEKATTFAGNKPRPLRLVQDHTNPLTLDRDRRGSWYGWAQGIVGNRTAEAIRE